MSQEQFHPSLMMAVRKGGDKTACFLAGIAMMNQIQEEERKKEWESKQSQSSSSVSGASYTPQELKWTFFSSSRKSSIKMLDMTRRLYRELPNPTYARSCLVSPQKTLSVMPPSERLLLKAPVQKDDESETKSLKLNGQQSTAVLDKSEDDASFALCKKLIDEFKPFRVSAEQVELHNAMLLACAPMIYGPENLPPSRPSLAEIFSPENGWILTTRQRSMPSSSSSSDK